MDMERAAIRAALFVFQGPKEACLELCWSRCFGPLSDVLSGIPGDLERRLGDPDAAVHHDPLA